ncbi:hypothetical protein BDN70DRAFT_873161 [Pholiota conissans]|uniref:Uncharacterized protein n=1 Tax=Pholiota conissans TaxID=109636 RepID=A0A9P5Z9L1_9AGAR|nr:hypothetical protein BDN70DRAFT_873161 [Pholiota conissans]
MLSARFPQATRFTALSRTRGRLSYTTEAPPTSKSAHSSLYSDTFPAMIPVFLLGSAVYLGLQLTQLNLSHEKHMEEALARVKTLEAEVDALQQQRAAQLQSSTVGPSSTSMSLQQNGNTSRWRWW